MTPLDRDLRYATAPLHERCVYALLFASRRAIEEVVALGRDPIVVVARALGIDREEAATELDRLRAAGLIGDGLTMLVGTRARRAPLATHARSAADIEVVRAALERYTGSRRALARELGCTEGALRAFASGRRALGAELLSSLAALLGARTDERVPDAGGTQAGTQRASLSPLLQGSFASELSTVEAKLNSGSESEGEGPGEGVVRTDCAPTRHGAGRSARCSNDGDPRARSRETRAHRLAPAADPVPPEGTVARRVYEAITTDVALAPIVRGPGDLAMRLAALCDGTTVDPAAEVISAGAWLTRNPGRWSDGAAGLLRWVKSSADKARAMPAPVVGAPRGPSPPERVDYQGRRAVGAAGLPSGEVWTNDRDEEAEAFERIRARTQPKGATGR